MSKSVFFKSLLAGGALLALQAVLSAAMADRTTAAELPRTGRHPVSSEVGIDHEFRTGLGIWPRGVGLSSLPLDPRPDHVTVIRG